MQGIRSTPTSTTIDIPLLLWRLGLQPVLGQWLALITYNDSRGELQRTISEYIGAPTGVKYVPVRFGVAWYDELMQNPNVTVQTADGTQSMRLHRVTEDAELLMVYDLLRQRYPELLANYLRWLGVEDTPEALVMNKERLYFIGFTPSIEETPPALESDLIWVWVALAVIWTIWRAFANKE